MGFRRLTATEYNYIKELLARHHNNIEKVVDISGRCTGTVKAIAASKNYKEYQHPLKTVKPAKVDQKPLIKTTEDKPAKSYDGAILAEINRLRKDVNALTEVLTKVFDRAGSDKPKQETLFTNQAPKAQG